MRRPIGGAVCFGDDMEIVTPGSACVLFLVGCIAGFVDSIAGGGGLISIPALLAVGLDPSQAIATNKLQSSFGSFSATLNFVRGGHVDLRSMGLPICAAFLGAALGATTIQIVEPRLLSDLLPILLMAIAGYFLFSPNLGRYDAKQRVSIRVFAATAALGMGYYDGFFGPGTGSLLALAFVTLLGFNLTKATAHTKLLNFTSNVASLSFFLFSGRLVWSVGFTMAAGQFLGARLGSKLVIRRGAGLVRPALAIVSLAITVRLVAVDEGNLLRVVWTTVVGWITSG